jgi:hypothetical protein
MITCKIIISLQWSYPSQFPSPEVEEEGLSKATQHTEGESNEGQNLSE